MTQDQSVAQIMSAPAITIGQEEMVADAARLMLEKNIGALPVVDGSGRCLGMVTEKSLMPQEEPMPFVRGRLLMAIGDVLVTGKSLDAALAQVRSMPVKQVMLRDVPVVDEDAGVTDVARRMVKHNLNHVPVVRRNRVVGIVSRHDVLKFLSG